MSKGAIILKQKSIRRNRITSEGYMVIKIKWLSECSTRTKWVQDKALLDGKGDPLGIVQEIEIWPYYQMVYAQTRICSREWDA